MKILIRGAWGDNKGAEAMLQTAIAELSARLPSIRWVVEKTLQDSERDLPLPVEIRRRKWGGTISEKCRLCVHILCCPSLIPFVIKRPGAALMLHRLLDDCDAVLDASGFAYGDVCGADSVELPALIAQYMHYRGRSMFFLPQAWGSFQSAQIRKDVVSLTTYSTRIAVRDALSFQAFDFLPARNKQCLQRVPDIAFLLPASKKADFLSKRDRQFLVYAENLIAVCPNMRIYDRTGGVAEQNQYVVFLKKLIQQLVSSGYNVVLTPHETYPAGDKRQDDNWLCAIITQQVNHLRCRHFAYDVTAAEWKSVYSHCRFVISSRFHALIAALSLCKPIIAIGWSHKYKELLRDFVLDPFAFAFTDLTQDNVMEAVRELDKSGLLVESRLQTFAGKTITDLQQYFDGLAGLLKKQVAK